MIVLGGYLSLNDFKSMVFEDKNVEISPEVISLVNESFEFLKVFSSNKIIYGVNTGFGPMAEYKIDDEQKNQLQYNLIRSHASGVGEPISPLNTKAAIIARLCSLSKGHSGVHPSLLELMRELVNRDITPLIFSHGGVGASGDLVQLAHLALVLIGEGEVFYKGVRRNTIDVFKETGLQPAMIHLREGLSLMNGTSVMTGIGIVNYLNAKKILDWSVKISCAINEIVATYNDHYSAELNNAKLHSGQREIAQMMRNHLEDSSLTRRREDHLYSGEKSENVLNDKVQEYYSLRCLPQILGPILDTINAVGNVLENELNSANDNPIVDLETQQVYHGGNFHGDYISLEMDKLKIVIAKLTVLAERQLNYLLNSKINGILPPFVNLGQLGFNFGIQGAQFTATSTTAESQMLSNPMYVHSIPNNNDNQDVVSMGTNSALITGKVIENAFEVLSIELIALVQAIDYLGYQEKVSSKTAELYSEIRKIIPTFQEDYVLYPYIERIKNHLLN